MSRLSDVVKEVVEATRDGRGKCDVHRAVEIGMPKLDEEARAQLVREAFGDRVKAQAEKGAKAIAKKAYEAHGTAPLFPELHRGYAVEAEGRVIIATEYLSRLDFERVIAVREKSVKDDLAHLNYLRRTLAAVAPVWDRNPSLTFGAVCEVYAEAKAA